ncbi:MAG: hypothetical protein U0903_16680, partial [Planctomycetales bacterium]
MSDAEDPLSSLPGPVQENSTAADAPPASVINRDPVPRLKEILALLLIVVISDVTLYRGEGFAGLSFLLAAAPLLLFLGTPHRERGGVLLLLWGMLLLLSARLLWCGFYLTAVVGFALLPCFSIALTGRKPYVPEACAFIPRLLYYGARGSAAYEAVLRKSCRRFTYAAWLTVLLPVAVGMMFSLLFVLANPDLVKSFHGWLSELVEWMLQWFGQNPMWEVVFWGGAAWIAIGLMRPFGDSSVPPLGKLDAIPENADWSTKSDPLFSAFRNTLSLVIVLFGAYLVFEFKTLWFRVFPAGFYYSGYAHEGAAWLTVALALATALLSLIFRGRVLRRGKI